MVETVSCYCPISSQRIRTAARGKSCKHAQCFDMSAALESLPEVCPLCEASLAEGLVEDKYMTLKLHMHASSDLKGDRVQLFRIRSLRVGKTDAHEPVYETQLLIQDRPHLHLWTIGRPQAFQISLTRGHFRIHRVCIRELRPVCETAGGETGQSEER